MLSLACKSSIHGGQQPGGASSTLASNSWCPERSRSMIRLCRCLVSPREPPQQIIEVRAVVYERSNDRGSMVVFKCCRQIVSDTEHPTPSDTEHTPRLLARTIEHTQDVDRWRGRIIAVATPRSQCVRVLDGALGDPYSSARRSKIDEGEKKVVFYRHEEGLPAAPHPTPDCHIPSEDTEVRCNKPGHR